MDCFQISSNIWKHFRLNLGQELISQSSKGRSSRSELVKSWNLPHSSKRLTIQISSESFTTDLTYKIIHLNQGKNPHQQISHTKVHNTTKAEQFQRSREQGRNSQARKSCFTTGKQNHLEIISVPIHTDRAIPNTTRWEICTRTSDKEYITLHNVTLLRQFALLKSPQLFMSLN